MAKRLTEKQKSDIAEYFKNGKAIEALAKEFNCSILTITTSMTITPPGFLRDLMRRRHASSCSQGNRRPNGFPTVTTSYVSLD